MWCDIEIKSKEEKENAVWLIPRSNRLNSRWKNFQQRHTWKKFQKRQQPKITIGVQENFFFYFGLVLAILCRVLPLGVVFSPKTTATSCQDADVFPGTSRGHYGPYDILDPMVQGPGVEISSVSTFRLLCLWDFCLSCLGSRGNSLPKLLSHYQRKNRCHSENSHFIHKQHQTKQNYMGKMREGQADKQRTHGKINVC